MIPHQTFGKMRLADYLPAGCTEHLDGWEYLGRQWLGEAYGFTEWLRLTTEPERVRSVALDLAVLPATVGEAVLADLGLGLRAGLSLDQVTDALGRPTRTERFVSDRLTAVFEVGTSDRYELGCTVHEAQGLMYLTVHTVPLPGEPDCDGC